MCLNNFSRNKIYLVGSTEWYFNSWMWHSNFKLVTNLLIPKLIELPTCKIK